MTTMSAMPFEAHPTERRYGLGRRRRGGRVAPLCDDTPWCGLTLYEHQAPHREALIVEMVEIEQRGGGSILIRRRIELCSWPCVENLAAARMEERESDKRQLDRRHEAMRSCGTA
jgi:hypothetical protein